MSPNTQEDSILIPSIVQPGAPLYHLPDPIPGSLTLLRSRTVGSRSDVYRGIWSYNGTENVVCIKCPRDNASPTDPSCPNLTPEERFERRLRRETTIWAQLNHPNILPFLGYQVVDGTPRLASPWMDQGTLTEYLKTHPNISNSDKLTLLEQVARGLAFLHGSLPPIAHGELEPQNILITDELTAVICNLENSRVVLEGHTGLTTSEFAFGSPQFQAKELIFGEPLPTGMSDIYAMGGVILETMSGMKPFHRARTPGMVMLWIATDQMPHPKDHPGLPLDDPLWPFLRQCWSPRPEERPTAVDVIEQLSEIIKHLRELEGRLRKAKPVGGGGYSEVYYGVWTQSSADPVCVAIKCIKRPCQGPDDGTETRFREHIGRQLCIWGLAGHENILPFFGYQIVGGIATLVSPWCENGNLRQYIDGHPELAPIKKLELLCDAAQGLAYLHSRTSPVIHGDIEPDNIVVTNNLRGALCGFGTSRVIACLGTPDDWTTMGPSAGTPGFQAKELYEEDAERTTMSDVYAFGGVILAAMSGKAPFYQIAGSGWARIFLAVHNNETASPDNHPELPGSDPLWGLLQSCWDAEPTQRPHIDKVIAELQHEIQRRSN